MYVAGLNLIHCQRRYKIISIPRDFYMPIHVHYINYPILVLITQPRTVMFLFNNYRDNLKDCQSGENGYTMAK